MNICAERGPLNWYPMMWEFVNVREFTEFIREQIFNILNWAHENWIPKSTLNLAVLIQEDHNSDDQWSWEFIIPVSNIREARPLIKLGREEFELELRNQKIEQII